MKTKLFFRFITILFLTVTIFSLESLHAQGVKVIIIDPGHGGKFPGAQYKGTLEKDLNLKVALKLGAIIKENHPDIKIIYTRKTDIHLSTSLSADLAARSKIANDAQGDLFISIHANAASNTAAFGAETIIMGESSLEKQRNDAALYTANKEDLIDMSDKKTAAIVRAYIQNLQFTYGQYSEALARLIQKGYESSGRKIRPLRRQPIMVLYGTDMPCVLTEMGFMSNANELAMMKSEKGQQNIAKSIYNGINEYIKMVNRTSTVSTTPNNKSNTVPFSKSNSALKSGYTIQMFSLSKVLGKGDKQRQLKTYVERHWLYTTTGKYRYKYCVGKYRTKEDAMTDLAKVRKSFKDAYIVPFKL